MGSSAVLALVCGVATTITNCDMIIACPACGTRYAVPDAAIGNEGRTVRCAKCKHSWFQDAGETVTAAAPTRATAPPASAQPPAPAARPEPAPNPAPAPAPAATTTPPSPPAPVSPAPEQRSEGPSVSHWRTPEEAPGRGYFPEDASLAARALRRGRDGQNEAPLSSPPSEPAPHPPAFAETPADAAADQAFAEDEDYSNDDGGEDEGSQFAYRAPFTKRRNPLRMWTLAALLFAALAGGTAFAVNYYGLPEWLPIQRPTFGVGQPGLELDFPKARQRKEPLENGEVIFRVRGTITNTATESLDVPNLLVVFSDRRDRNIGDWVVVPAKRRLAPGETVTVTEAINNIPPGAAVADLGWAPR